MQYRRTAPWLIVLVCSTLVFGACALLDSSEPEPREQQNEETTDNDGGDDNQDGEANDNNQDNDNADQNDETDNDETDNDGESEVAERVEKLVASGEYEEMIIEVDYVEGRQTRDGIDDRLVEGLKDVVDKPEGIEVDFRDEITESAPSEGWSLGELQSLIEDYGSVDDDGAIEVHTLLVDGEYEPNESVLGIAWANRNLVMFMDRIEEACQNASLLGLDRERLCEHAELTVWRHEMGHVLGLVDVGAPLQSDHEDEDNDAHCTHDECVMYWAYRSPDMMDRLVDRLGSGESAPDFDPACREDLEAIQ